MSDTKYADKKLVEEYKEGSEIIRLRRENYNPDRPSLLDEIEERRVKHIIEMLEKPRKKERKYATSEKI